MIYLDFAKAFDTVPHKRLIHKLRAYGIRGKVLRWITNFLSHIRQKVVLHNGNSSWENVISGVPQGSILGPILFLLYVNDIPSIVSSTAKMFADDTKLYCPVRTIDDCQQRCPPNRATDLTGPRILISIDSAGGTWRARRFSSLRAEHATCPLPSLYSILYISRCIWSIYWQNCSLTPRILLY